MSALVLSGIGVFRLMNALILMNVHLERILVTRMRFALIQLVVIHVTARLVMMALDI